MTNLDVSNPDDRSVSNKTSPEDLIRDIKEFILSIDCKKDIRVQDGQVSVTIADPSRATILRSLLIEADKSGVIGFRSSSNTNKFECTIYCLPAEVISQLGGETRGNIKEMLDPRGDQ